jgi:hypothetical protein
MIRILYRENADKNGFFSHKLAYLTKEDTSDSELAKQYPQETNTKQL